MFKRGFLNSEKARKTMSTEDAVPKPPTVEKLPDGLESVVFESNPDFHIAPPNVLQGMPPGKTRTVFRHWPRDPKGQVMQKERAIQGKITPNGYQLWGETLYDFFRTTPLPGVDGYSMISTSSKLATWMREHGELSATHELEWAEKEKEPKQIFPCDVGRLIRDREADAKRGWLAPGSPFSKRAPPVLEERIPHHLLPKKLIVHDPWNTLSVAHADDDDDEDIALADKPDVVHAYRLSRSKAGLRKCEEDAERARKAAEEEAASTVNHLYMPGDYGTSLSLILHVTTPPLPPLPTSVDEAHVYIRRRDLCGEGNHSIVYLVEWELPRWLLVGREETFCDQCILKMAEVEIKKRHEAGTLYDRSADASPISSLDCPSDTPIVHVELNPKVQSSAGRGELCEHFQARFDGPLGGEAPATARVVVCAKLSRQFDTHLPREASNYQLFPDWFFEHWSGYNVVKPLQDPTPCGAIVPNFYGYYVPDESEAAAVPRFSPTAEDSQLPPSPRASDDDAPEPVLPKRYLSPILLLEYCGKQIEPDELSIDDRQEATSLFLHMSRTGWMQGSIAARNVLVQPGPLSEWPLGRMVCRPPKNSFRLIDFGRAVKLDRWPEEQDSQVMQLFDLGPLGRGTW